jgi:hypothetical protein
MFAGFGIGRRRAVSKPGPVSARFMACGRGGERPWLCPIVEDPGILLAVGLPGCLTAGGSRAAAPRRVFADQALGRHSFQAVWLLRSEDGQSVIFGEVLVVFEVQGGERGFVGEAAGRDPHVVDRAGPGRPRRLAAADRRPQMAATASSPGRTGMPDSQAASSPRRWAPQRRISAHLASSPNVMKVISGSRPIRRVASGPVSLPRWSNEATSVSRMTGCIVAVRRGRGGARRR